MKIYILTDDIAKKRGILAEHGLSLWIESGRERILFDTGQSDVYCRNARTMGLDLDSTDCMVLSHGHYDHCGGLSCFSAAGQRPEAWVQQAAFEKKTAANPDGVSFREIGIPWKPGDCNGVCIRTAAGRVQMAESATLLGGVDGTLEWERPRGLFVEREGRMVPDTFQDEQILVLETPRGLAVFLGCSHPGVIGCLRHVQRHFPGSMIDTLVAGMHLEGADAERIARTIEELRKMNIRLVAPLHCTGIRAITEMEKELGGSCRVLYAGDTLDTEAV